MVARNSFRWFLIEYQGVNFPNRFPVFFKLVFLPHQLRAQTDDAGGNQGLAALRLCGWNLLSSRQTCEQQGHEAENGKGDFNFWLHSLIDVGQRFVSRWCKDNGTGRFFAIHRTDFCRVLLKIYFLFLLKYWFSMFYVKIIF